MNEPRHVAIIMDGNGRWAESQGLPRSAGHKAGIKALCEIVRYANEINLQWLTLFAFSSENWARPQKEVGYLLELLQVFIENDLMALNDANVRIKIIGDREHLSEHIADLLHTAEKVTHTNTGLTLIVAFNYGSRNEIIRAVNSLLKLKALGKLSEDKITQELFERQLDSHGIPDPDLIIRTGGELRLSNFLLWQAAYSELYFCEKFWPEFTAAEFTKALKSYKNRERRFGGISLKTKENTNC